jgi:hypothetical protein
MEQSLTIVTLGTHNVPVSTSFVQSLGWRASWSHENVTFFQCGGVALALYPRAELAQDAGVASGQRTHCCRNPFFASAVDGHLPQLELARPEWANRIVEVLAIR